MAFRFILVTIFAFIVITAGCGWLSGATDTDTNTTVPDTTEPTVYGDAQAALAAGNKFFEENRTEEAIDAYVQAVKLDPDMAEAYFKLGISYSLIESEQELIVTSADPEEANGGEKKAKRLNSTVAFENAVKAYKKIIDEDPKNDIAFFNLGRVYNRLNEDKDSRKALETAVKLKPEDTQYQTELGAILMKLAQYDEAVRALRKALEIDEANAQAADMLVKAEAGKKRVDFGADKLKDQLKSQQNSSSGSNKPENKDDRQTDKETPSKTPEPDKKKEPEKKKPGAVRVPA